MFDNYIDFDNASKEWMMNKKKLKNGYFEYTCNYIHSNGKQCKKPRLSSQIKNDYITGFVEYNIYKIHPNTRDSCFARGPLGDQRALVGEASDYYCKQHINKKRTL